MFDISFFFFFFASGVAVPLRRFSCMRPAAKMYVHGWVKDCILAVCRITLPASDCNIFEDIMDLRCTAVKVVYIEDTPLTCTDKFYLSQTKPKIETTNISSTNIYHPPKLFTQVQNLS